MHSKIKFIILDGARIPDQIIRAREINKYSASLYKGDSMIKLSSVSPYLFELRDKNPFMKWFFEEGWENSWGIIIATHLDFEDCQKHFRKFLIVANEEGQEFYFRFYDPRVLKIFLPTCDRSQIANFFGHIDNFIIEGDKKEEAIKFSHQNGILQQEVISTSEIFDDPYSISQ